MLLRRGGGCRNMGRRPIASEVISCFHHHCYREQYALLKIDRCLSRPCEWACCNRLCVVVGAAGCRFCRRSRLVLDACIARQMTVSGNQKVPDGLLDTWPATMSELEQAGISLATMSMRLYRRSRNAFFEQKFSTFRATFSIFNTILLTYPF